MSMDRAAGATTGQSILAPAAPPAPPLRRRPTSPGPSARRQLALLVSGFVLTVALFMGSSLYADSRLAAVAGWAHDVSDNALPSILEIGMMRRSLAAIQFDLSEATEGNALHLVTLPVDLVDLAQARRNYLALPEFRGESELWAAVTLQLDEVLRVVAAVRTKIEAGDLGAASAVVSLVLSPAARDADESLGSLARFNRDEAKRAASEADGAWARTRQLSLVADTACALITGALALFAYRGVRRFMSVQNARADELEAFASRVAHDVRGPLSPAMFTLQMFERDFAADEKRHGWAVRAIRSLSRVNQLVDDLLTFARAGVPPEDDVHASLSSVVAGVVQDLEQHAAAASVRLDVADLPACEVACAPGVLSSIVMNLVSNAVKHMPAEAPERRVLVRARADRDCVRVEVADTGAGLAPSMHERVFEPYVRADKREPGLGLGLATVRRLVQSHGGRVGVRSEEGAGATFWFDMPLRVAPSSGNEIAKAAL
jgi:signal transduction histidine kinase